MMIWKTEHAAAGAAGMILMTGLCALLGDQSSAIACMLVASVLTAIYMVGPAEDEEG
jgi:hypothetical protein